MLQFSRFSCGLVPYLFIIRRVSITYGSNIIVSNSQMFDAFRFEVHKVVQ